MTLAHEGTRDEPARAHAAASSRSEQVERHAEGLVCLSGCAREGALARRSSAATWAAPSGSAGGCWRVRARALPRRAPAAVLAPRPRAQPRARAARRAARRRRAWRPATCTPTTPTAPACRTPSSPCACARRSTRPSPSGAATRASVMASPAEMAARFRDHPSAVAETARLAERLEFDLTRDLGYRYPGSEDPDADRKLAELCRRAAGRALPGDGASATRPRARLEEELRVIRKLGLSGFFLLHHDMLELAREVAVEVRGASAGAPPAPARARPRLERQLDRLLPDRPLAHRPDPQQAAARPLPERGDHVAARHRPRLPARHPREADPARARALRHRARRAGRGVRDLPLEGRDPRPRQGARAAGGRDRARRALGRRVRRRRRLPARRRGGDRRAARRLAALAGADRAGPGGLRPAAPRLPAPRRDGDRDRAADRPLPGAALGDGGPQPRAVGQGLVRRRRLPEDRPARAWGCCRRSSAAWTRSRACAASGSTSRASHYDDREVYETIQRAETTGVFQIESRAQMQSAAPHAAGDARRPHRAGRARAARADPGRRRAPLYREARAAARGPGLPGPLRAPVARAGAAATRSA